MTIEPQIKNIIEKLNPNWFNELKEEFVNHPFYDKGSESIDDSIQEYASGYDPETGEIVEDVYDVVIQATLAEYAWQGKDFYISHEEELDLVPKANSLNPDIVAAIEPLLIHINDIQGKYNLIGLVRQYMTGKGNELKQQLDDSNYHDVIDYCIYKLKVGISEKYISIARAHDTIAVYEDKLLFDLSQKELAVLLALLVDCDFIHGTKYNNNHLNFFRKYFHFKNQKAGNNFQRAIEVGLRARKKINTSLR
jgi:hypothetical protein